MDMKDYFRKRKPIEDKELLLAIPFSNTLFIHTPIIYPFNTTYEIREESKDGYEWSKYIEGDEGHTIELYETGEFDVWKKVIIEEYLGHLRKINIEEKWKMPGYYKLEGYDFDELTIETPVYEILDRNYFEKTLAFGDVEIYLTGTQQILSGDEYWVKEFWNTDKKIQKNALIATILEKRMDEKGRKWNKTFKRII
ncbi:MAG: hypothetical protein DRP06_01825 [Candidatus Aenigmatarchaeota archaeon]|nr:MAG: hypothetical protein DRP06_01825 [Candidatus Aenigmarchaeota archaeon]